MDAKKQNGQKRNQPAFQITCDKWEVDEPAKVTIKHADDHANLIRTSAASNLVKEFRAVAWEQQNRRYTTNSWEETLC